MIGLASLGSIICAAVLLGMGNENWGYFLAAGVVIALANVSI